MGEGYWVIRTYKSGSVGEKTKFWVPGQRPKKGGRRLKSDIRKALANEHSAVKTVARLINANFKRGDILLGLDYSDAGLEKLRAQVEEWGELDEAGQAEALRRAAEREVKLCLRRVKYAMGEKTLKYISVTSDMDGKTGELVRIHHHLVINAEGLAAFEKAWKLGGVHYSRLKGQKDYTAIAEYLMEQVRKIPDAKKYSPSRNLLRPQPQDRIAMNGSELNVPRGAVILHRTEYKIGRPQYIRYILPEAAERDYGRQREIDLKKTE